MRRTSNLPQSPRLPANRAARLGGVVASVVALGALSAGCSSGDTSSASTSGSNKAGASQNQQPAAKVTIAADVPNGSRLGLAQPVTVKAEDLGSSDARITDVVVKDSSGKDAGGRYDASRQAWIPDGVLTKNGSYVVTATAKTSDGRTTSASRKLVAAQNGSGTTGIYVVTPYKRMNVGNAQPVSLTFSQAVPESMRAEVTKRFTVKDSANVQGAWRWVSPTRLDYRPKDRWPVGDHVTVTGSIQSMRIGDTWGAGTLKDTGFDVTSDLEAVYDPATHEVTVTEGGKTIRVMKSGGGKRGFESLTGKMVVMGKERTVRMTSCSVGISCTPGAANFYDEQINNAVQVSESGTYLHAAPWDGLIGRADTSHGCFHLSAADAAWFYDKVLPGNMFISKGSNNPIKVTNGEGDWNLSWQEWTS